MLFNGQVSERDVVKPWRLASAAEPGPNRLPCNPAPPGAPCRFAVKSMPKRFAGDGTLEAYYVRRVLNEVDICNHLGRCALQRLPVHWGSCHVRRWLRWLRWRRWQRRPAGLVVNQGWRPA